MRLRLVGAVVGIVALQSTANAQLTIDMSLITCEQYLAMKPAMSRDFSAWMSGWFSYQKNITDIDPLLHQKNVSNVRAWCQYHPRDKVMTGLQDAIKPQ